MRVHLTYRALLGGLAFLLSASVAMTQESKLPDGVKHVPLDAMGFVHIRAGDFLKSDLGKNLLKELLKDREASKGLKEAEQMIGIEAADLESVTLLMLAPPNRMQINPWERQGFGPGFNGRKPVYKEKMRIEMKKEGFKFEDKKDIEGKKEAVRELPVLFLQPGAPPAQEGHMLAQDIEEIDAPDVSSPLVILTSAKPLDRKKILRAQYFKAKTGTRDDFLDSQSPGVLFLSDRTVMVGPSYELARYSETMAGKPKLQAQALKSALALAADPHLVVAGGQMPAEWRRMYWGPYSPFLRELAPLAPLLHAEAGLTLDFDNSIDLKLHLNTPTESSASNAEQAVKTLRVLAELALEKSQEGGESGGWKLQLEKSMAKALADVRIEKKGTTVQAQLKMDVGPAVVKHLSKEFIAIFRSRGDRARSVNNLKQIGLALHFYHDVNKALPPAGISDADGKPLLSWRVAILPYLEQQALYQQFDLNQPWDHPTNKKLIAQMPPIYRVPGAETKEGETNYRVLVGPGSIFELRKGPGGKATGPKLFQITDGTSNTIMVVEAAEPTIWTRPDDLPYNPNGPLPKLGISPEGFNALMADGSVRFIRSTTREDVLRPYLTGNNGLPRQPHD